MATPENLKKIQDASVSQKTETNFDALTEQASELLTLLQDPNVIQKLISVDPLHRTAPTYNLITCKRDDTGDDVSLLLFSSFTGGEKPNFHIIGQKYVYTGKSDINRIIQDTMGANSKKTSREFLNSSWPEYIWDTIDETGKNWAGTIFLYDPKDLVSMHGSHLESISKAILKLVAPPEAKSA